MTLRVAVAQLAPGPDRATNEARTLALLQEAADAGAGLLVLPELCTSPYQLGEEPLAPWATEIPDGALVQEWRRACQRLGITLVAGLLEREGQAYFNTALRVTPDGQVARYRKVHLFGWERRRLTPGSTLPSVWASPAARLASLICYDLRFLEAVRLLALAGVQLLCVPTTWTDVGKPQPFDRYGLPAAAHLVLGHAYANRIFVLCAGRVGQEKGVRYLGSSLIAAPNGQILAGPADGTSPALLLADIEPTQADDKRIGPDNHVLADRREDLYRLEVVGSDEG